LSAFARPYCPPHGGLFVGRPLAQIALGLAITPSLLGQLKQLAFAAPRSNAPGGFSFSRSTMITSNTKTSAVVVTAPRPLTKEQRETVRVEVASNLPANVGVIVLDPGFAIAPVGDATILAELQALRADLAAQHEERTIARRPLCASE